MVDRRRRVVGSLVASHSVVGIEQKAREILTFECISKEFENNFFVGNQAIFAAMPVAEPPPMGCHGSSSTVVATT